MKCNRRGKIIAAIDPMDCNLSNLNKLYAAGADAFSLDFSSGSLEDYARVCEIIRIIGKKHHTFPTILADLQEFNKTDIEKLSSSALAIRKNKIDWKFITDLGIDWIVLPPTMSVEDIAEVKDKVNNGAGIVATLDKSSIANAFEPIVEISDAILISNGNIGADSLSADVQQNIIGICSRLRRPAIIGIQISESAVSASSSSPVGSLKLDDTMYMDEDAVMLFIGSLAEKYQYEVVKFVGKAMDGNECNFSRGKYTKNEAALPNKNVIDAICAAAKEAAESSCADIIVLFTGSLETIIRCSRICVQVPIILVTESSALASKSGLCRGIYPAISKKEFNIEQICKTAKVIVLDHGFATAGDLIVVLDDISGNSVIICRL
ncbi:MAG: hypothetical protein LBF44_00795 [Holosporaceae bacterium]|jgi:pyruvate kinase|nr:hypothetical protein [Holosporaceae bacterium]